MNEYKVKGLVIRCVDLKESDRLITVYTAEMGIQTALARGARNYKSKLFASTANLCYSSFVLVKNGEHFRIKEAELIESFYGIRGELDSLALSAYVSEILLDVSTAEADEELLRLALNSLYVISEKKHPLIKVKAAFEIRAAAILGFMPDVTSCALCGESHGDYFFEIMAGRIICRACNEKNAKTYKKEENPAESHIVCLLSEAAKIALAYCIYAPLEKLFSFKIPDADMQLFAKASEEYIINQLERSFKTLDFYNEVKR